MDTTEATRATGLFAQNLRTARIARGLSTADVAASAGVGVRTVQRVEAGQQSPSFDVAAALAAAVGMEIHVMAHTDNHRGGASSGNGAAPAREGA